MANMYKLKVVDVIRIKHFLETGELGGQRQIAKAFNVDKTAIGEISTGKNWRWMPDVELEDLPLIESLSSEGISDADIADKFEAEEDQIRKLLRQLARERGEDVSNFRRISEKSTGKGRVAL